jgi:hypothetical protein
VMSGVGSRRWTGQHGQAEAAVAVPPERDSDAQFKRESV